MDVKSGNSNLNGMPTSYEGLSPSEEALPPLPTHQYEDYLRECQDIRQSVVISSSDEEKLPISRTDSGEDHEEDAEAEWFRMAGLSDLVMSSSNTMLTSTDGTMLSHRGPDNLSSMTVLSTLTRPQREAVLRRISSFNRAQVQKTKRKSKPTIAQIFPSVELPHVSTPSDHEKSIVVEDEKLEKPTDLQFKSSRSLTSPTEGEEFNSPMPRRFSEVTRFRAPSMPAGNLIDFSDTSHGKMDLLSKHKKNVNSIVASNLSGGIETISISSNDSWNTGKFTPRSDTTGKDSISYTETAKDDNLPNFSLVKDRLGITKISHLHQKDFRMVQNLAIIELTALFDVRNLDLKRRKMGKNKLKETAVFGTPLTTLVEYDRKRTNNDQLRIPIVLSEIIFFLEKNALTNEGILRKSGSAARIKVLKHEIDTRLGINATQSDMSFFQSQQWKEANPNDVAALLKQFLRELPEPLLTTQFIDAFQSCSQIPDRKQQLQALNLLVILINDVHRDSLKLLLKFLNLIIMNEEENKMTLNNVAMITAPNLFISGRKSTKKDAAAVQDIKYAAGTSNMVRMLIKYHKLLWTIPAFMLSQVRVMNSAQLDGKKHHSTSKDKYKKFFQGRSKDMKKLHQATRQPFDYDTPKGLIRVQAPNMKLTSIAVQLDDNLTSGDVIVKYHRQLERMLPNTTGERLEVNNQNYALYEVGGNIHERCLEPNTFISSLLRENPEATWYIKQRKDS